ncbi:Tyrosine-protein kinase ephrin type A/B receptor-like [Cinara cedri]|uniref:Tyrosine-protein kinase ephrin type A/B receptor-like n=1 Tax=Cinara cedri TaxID=506608 RepID=A0A5E4MRH1_9HEMI|nr:Tyrosine-protein kinase ephrin type A/B receptor-like [Cinara cedri]
MICFNPRPLFVVGYWTICSVTTIFGRVTNFARAGGNVAEYDCEWDGEMAKRLDGHNKPAMVGSSWPPAAKCHGGGGKGDRKLQNDTAKYAGRSSESSGGAQWRARKWKPTRTPSGKSNASWPPGGRRRATVRPSNATQEAGRQSKTSDRGVSRTTTHSGAAAPRGGRKVFGDENDCVSASDGRPCVCYMTDFLDSVGQLLDEAKLVRDDTAAAVAAFACPSYKTVPPAFVVYPWPPPSTATAVRLSGQISDRKNKNETADVAAAPSRKKVDFDYVVNYRLEKSKDAIDKPIYEILGTALYKTDSGSGCVQEIIDPMIKKLPGFMQNEICPEGSSQHACNVVVESSKCLKNENSLEIKYAVTLNDKANYLTRVRTSRKGQNALFYQKLLAKISNVLVGNLNKTLAVQIQSKYSLIDTYFKSDLTRKIVNKFVSCKPGFGIREVFCSACPPHHYSPDKSADCLKCSKGFYQPVAGSVKCVKCPNFLANGCNKINTKYTV